MWVSLTWNSGSSICPTEIVGIFRHDRFLLNVSPQLMLPEIRDHQGYLLPALYTAGRRFFWKSVHHDWVVCNLVPRLSGLSGTENQQNKIRMWLATQWPSSPRIRHSWGLRFPAVRSWGNEWEHGRGSELYMPSEIRHHREKVLL